MAKFEDTVKLYNARMMKDLQLKDFHCFGIWGNIGTETGGLMKLQELKPLVKGSKGGYGWSQWTGPRRRKYEAWCKAQNLLPADDETNYRYLIHETLTDEWKSLAQVRKTTTLDAATETWMLLNLRPGIPHLENRKAWARKAQAAMQPTMNAKTAAAATGAAGAAAGVVVASQYVPTNYVPYILAGAAVVAAIGAAIYVWKN